MQHQEGKLGLNVNALMREVLVTHGVAYAEASVIVNEFAAAFDALTGTEWLEVNGTTEWKLTFDARARPLSEDARKRQGTPASCPCGRTHRRNPYTRRAEHEE